MHILCGSVLLINDGGRSHTRGIPGMLAQVKKHRSRAQTFAIAVRVLFTNFVDTDNCYFIPIFFFCYTCLFFFFIHLFIYYTPPLPLDAKTNDDDDNGHCSRHYRKKKVVIIKPNCAYNGIALENTARNKIYARARRSRRRSGQSE